MAITHHGLHLLGFVTLNQDTHHYGYKGFVGTLNPLTGSFCFQDFSIPISTLDDLQFLVQAIDNKPDNSLLGLPLYDN
ncbi:hypothetical protein [Spirosoma gilvum]